MIKATRGDHGVDVEIDGTLGEIISEIAAITMQLALITEAARGQLRTGNQIATRVESKDGR